MAQEKKKKRIKQLDIVEKTGIDKSTISRYLSGEKTPSLRIAKYISDKTGLPMDIFLSRAAQQIHLGKVYLKHDVFIGTNSKGAKNVEG
ncbi:helix-turn-helix domain-containing protein [Nitratifractor salsuginis]|uniref:Helix-turn-helix domain protein n=1 Tax=Nitratifractor salsuginis (strain DSM 16511 / JCM 12458 / E9I37-1) TaxID=749222 RepID=E6WYD9_NITSE|nr:helix-turn-helix transcriptional regulator [Nitratifractor salsuginis]ADV46451.1 helix-turn-helix domain protein [Nitratifractor salsuginis DSM 16511]